MQSNTTNAEAGTAKDSRSVKELLSALKSIERISRPETKIGYCNVDPIDLLKSVRSIALKAIK